MASSTQTPVQADNKVQSNLDSNESRHHQHHQHSDQHHHSQPLVGSSDVKIGLKYAFKMHSDFAPLVPVGPTPTAVSRSFAEITGGYIKGPEFEAQALHGAGDWARIGSDGYAKLGPRIHYKTSQDEVIYVNYYSHLEMTEKVQGLLGRVPGVSSMDYGESVLVCNVTVETSAPRLAHLNRTIFVGKGRIVFQDDKYAFEYEVYSLV